MPNIKKICGCGKEFFVKPYREHTSYSCSRSCAGKFMPHRSGFKNPKGSIAKLGIKNPMYGKVTWMKGKKHKPESIEKMRLAHLGRLVGENNPRWAGEKIGRYGVHDWIKRERGLAKYGVCEKKDETCKGIIDWSNISQKYLRKVDDWQILCRSHHRRYDHEFKKLTKPKAKPNGEPKAKKNGTK